MQKAGTPPDVLHPAHLRASQINGCGPCVDGGVKHARQAGEGEERLFAVAAWRETPYFNERALGGLVLWIATTNLFNRVNVATRQIAGAAW